MLMTRWDPRSIWSELNRMHEEMERLLSGNGWRGFEFGVGFPALNVWKDDNNLYVEAELPGFELSDLEIVVTGDRQLSIKGERKQPEIKNGTWHRQERYYGSFSRMIELPESVDPDKVTAELKLGVLTVTLPKREEAKPRRIEVKAC
ncbi:MAG: molecular chaperone Hsp20 [Pirellulaceae bacterium]|nr:MAG: molecular chaperone Hsp20 [Pirellulaceae bacterium]